MISAAACVLDRAEAGVAKPEEFHGIPRFQWDVYFAELSDVCPYRLKWAGERIKQRNALRIEVLPENLPRCSLQSPDGRGLAWVLSGGSTYAYGQCQCSACPLRKGEA